MGELMRVTTDTESYPGLVMLAVAGELDLNSSPELTAEVRRLADAEIAALVFDLRELTFCDSTGLSALVRARNLLAGTGGRIAVGGAIDRVQRVLEMSGLVEFLNVHPSVAAARAALH
jgi:anti-anti-sigma factor